MSLGHLPEASTLAKLEPFGFVDGVSQPAIRGTYKALRGADPIHVVEPGEFILGYPDNRGNLPAGPTLAAHHDSANLLPIAAERQFEFIQQSWLQATSFRGLTRERDPVVGSRDRVCGTQADDGFNIPTREAPVRLRAIPDFVRTIGGGYFFVPGRSVLQFLSSEPR